MPTKPSQSAQVAIIGAGASGLMTAICIARSLESHGIDPRSKRILLIDGSQKIGIKILVAGGGRCNVTHHEVDEHQYATTKPAIVRSVLKRFSAQNTIDFFNGLGVTLKQEPTGKMFPTTDDAHTVLHALLDEVDRLGIFILNPWRVERVERQNDGFVLYPADDHPPIQTHHLVMATGGKALPKSGSDGHGYHIIQSLGHSITPNILPALVPLVADPRSDWIRELSGISTRATISAVSATGKRLKTFTNDLLCTHFGLSGPAPMDISRYLTTARQTDKSAHLEINWTPGQTFDDIDRLLATNSKSQILTQLRSLIPERLARALCEQANLDPSIPGHALTRDSRRALAHLLTGCKVYIQSDRGFTHAEVTAGGVPLEEINRKDFQSRITPNLWIVGEILDVDGRIGGYNFQWAWSTGQIAGSSIAKALLSDQSD